jgi:hypothetical protein
MMLGYCLHGLCTFPNMVIHANIARKSENKGRKYTDMYCCGMVFTWSVHIEIIAIKQGKDRDGAHC